MISKYEAGSYVVTGPHTLFAGAVVRLFTREEQIMSDVWATVSYAECWDAVNGRLVSEAYSNSEFGYHIHHISVEVDATAETLEAVAAFKAEQVRKEAARKEAAREAERQVELKTPRVGKIVVVARGRKVPKGTTGVVIWYGPGKAYSGPAPMRVGVKDSTGEVHWTDAKNVDVIETDTAKAA
jgi:hypothetical protein